MIGQRSDPKTGFAMESFGQGQDVDLRNSAERRPGPRVPTSSEKAHLFWQPWPYTERAKRETAAPVRWSGRGGGTRANTLVL